MSGRKEALGRVWQEPDGAFSECLLHPAAPTEERYIVAAFFPTVKEAADALRAHLRTEHADLFEACKTCRGSGRQAWPVGHGITVDTCRRCHGRGWVWATKEES